MFGEASDAADEGQYEWEWDPSAQSKVTTHRNGTTGWGRILRSINAKHLAGSIMRIHMCAQQPCLARYPPSKYGLLPPPVHMREVPNPFGQPAVLEQPVLATAVAEPTCELVTAVAGHPSELPPVPPPAMAAPDIGTASAVVPGTTVAEPSDELSPPEASPEKEPAPEMTAPEIESAKEMVAATAVAEPTGEEPPPQMAAPEIESASEVVPAALLPALQMGPVDVRKSPEEAVLRSLRPPAPASPIDLTGDSEVNKAAVAGRGVQAKHKIDAALLSLAREIRRPRAYVGYSAFVLMALDKKYRTCVWEGAARADLLEWAAPWATQHCSREPLMDAIACAVVAKAGGSVECFPISCDRPLQNTSHFVAGTRVPAPEAAVAVPAPGFEICYAALGVATIPSICDGDCALDVMTMMLGLPQSFAVRKQLRIDISDYLITRFGEPWMHDVMVVLQELELVDVRAYRSGGGAQMVAAPSAAPMTALVAAAEPVDKSAIDEDLGKPDEESFAAMRWASKLNDDVNVLSLLRCLPKPIVEEQVQLYRKRDETAVAAKAATTTNIQLTEKPRYRVRMSVAQSFHTFCHKHGLVVDHKMPYGAVKTFILDHIEWKGSQNKGVRPGQIRQWHKVWRNSPSSGLAAVAEEEGARPGRSEKSMLMSKARVISCCRVRAFGGGRSFKAPLVRQTLYEWWSSIRYAIDWRQLIAENRMRGRKHLARFPRSVMRLRVNILLQDSVHASLLNGRPVVSFKPDSWWFKRWEEEYGLSMRVANRKYSVPRKVQKERLDIFWVNLFRIRLFVLLAFGREPMVIQF